MYLPGLATVMVHPQRFPPANQWPARAATRQYRAALGKMEGIFMPRLVTVLLAAAQFKSQAGHQPSQPVPAAQSVSLAEKAKLESQQAAQSPSRPAPLPAVQEAQLLWRAARVSTAQLAPFLLSPILRLAHWEAANLSSLHLVTPWARRVG
jgi:hypothetical protein